MAAPAITAGKLRVENFERVSTSKQETERQKYDLADNVEQYDLDVVGAVRLKISGPKVRQSPEWNGMIERMKSPDRDGINISALDRLLRPEDFDIIGAALQVFRDYKKVIVSTKEGLIEPWTPRGWEICMQAMLQAGKELAELKRRTKGGRRKAHAENKPMNTAPPYGLAYIDKYSRDAAGRSQYFIEDLTPSSHPGMSRRQVVEMIFRWRHEERLKTHRIVRRLNEMKILTGGLKKKDGAWQYEPGLWSRSTVIQLLQNRHYIGEHWEGGKKIDVPCPQFIDRDVFEAVQETFLKGGRTGRQTRQRLLSEYLYCDGCKHPLYVHFREPNRSSYRCIAYDHKFMRKLCDLRQILCRRIEPFAFALIWRLLTAPELLLENARAYAESRPARESTAAQERELADVIARIDRTARMVHMGTFIHNGVFDEDAGHAAIREDQKRIAEIKAELRAADSVFEMPDAKVIEVACRKIAEGPMPSRFDTQRPILEKLVDLKMYYGNEYIEITGKVPVPASLSKKGHKCSGRVGANYTSALYIPFKIKERVA